MKTGGVQFIRLPACLRVCKEKQKSRVASPSPVPNRVSRLFCVMSMHLRGILFYSTYTKRALFICLLNRAVLWMLLQGNTNKYELKSSLRAYCIAALKVKSFYTVRTFLCHLLLFHLHPACFRILHKCLQWMLGEYLC